MKVKLLKDNRIDGKAGDTVEVTPARAAFLIRLKMAVPAEEEKPVKATKKAAKPKEEATEEKKPARKTGAKK